MTAAAQIPLCSNCSAVSQASAVDAALPRRAAKPALVSRRAWFLPHARRREPQLSLHSSLSIRFKVLFMEY